MSNNVSLPPGQAGNLAVLLDALDGVPITDAEQRTMIGLGGWEGSIVENVAAVIPRVRQTGRGQR